MEAPFDWPAGLLSIDTAEFDRALRGLRRANPAGARDPAHIRSLASRLRKEPGIPRREFDRRFRLVISAVADGTPDVLQAIAAGLRDDAPEALNAIRTLLPAELRHVTVSVREERRPDPPLQMAPGPAAPHVPPPDQAPGAEPDGGRASRSAFFAVALVGTPDEHVRNEALLRSHDLQPLRLPSLEDLWNVATTGLCGFVIGGSVWRHLPPPRHAHAVRLICEHSTFLFSRTCVDGLAPGAAESFTRSAAEARCGPLDGRKFCHGQDCELSLADVGVLRETARLLEAAGNVDFFPLGLSEPDAGLLRLIAEERRASRQPVTIRRLGTRELAGGRSGARVFLLNDGSAHPFVAKVGNPEELAAEMRRYREWIADWEPSVTGPAFHTHLGSAALTYRLHAAPDAGGHPAPTLDDRLEQLRSAEWAEPLERCETMADDLRVAVERAIDRLVALNTRQSARAAGDTDFWLHWPVRDLALRGIDFSVVDADWKSMNLWELVSQAVGRVEPNTCRGVVHGDIHGRNVLMVDRLPAFIDFALSGPGHPLADLIRLDAVVRTSAMRMLLNKQSMHDLFRKVHVDGADAASVLSSNAVVAASPLAKLAVCTAVSVRKAALRVAGAHGLDVSDYYAMHCIVSAHILAHLNPGSGIERLMLSVLGPAFLSARGSQVQVCPRGQPDEG